MIENKAVLKKQIKQWLMVGLCCFVAFMAFYPVLYALLSAFKTDAEMNAVPPKLIPRTFMYIQNFIVAIRNGMVFRFMYNSFVIAVMGTVARASVAILAAFAFSFFKFPLKNFFFFFIMGTMMIPGDALLMANYLTTSRMGLVNTYLGIAMYYFLSANYMFIMRQSFRSLSTSLREAALIDGCPNYRFLLNICIPCSKPAITSIVIASFVGMWNAYVWPLLITTDMRVRTVQVGITMLSFPDNPSIAPQMAAIMLVLIPSVFVFLMFQKNFVSGITVGAVKG